jgi:hypothetical protein
VNGPRKIEPGKNAQSGKENKDSDKKGKGSGKKIGIAIAVVVAIVLLFLIAYIIVTVIMGSSDSDRERNRDRDREDRKQVTEELEEDTDDSDVMASSAASTEAGASVPDVDEDSDDDSGEDSIDTEDTAIHRYELCVEDVTWTEAWQRCIDKGGYLAHINSTSEYVAIVDQILAEDKRGITFWLGAKRDEDSYDYYWINADGTKGVDVLNRTDAYVGFWLDGEPNFVDNDTPEEYLDMFYRSDEDRFVWNDAPGDLVGALDYYSGRIGYICEYED